MPITAYIRNPLTDLTGMMLTNQFMSPCSRLEEKTVNCYEAYGADKGSVNCKDLVEDLYECVTRTKEVSSREVKNLKCRKWGNMDTPFVFGELIIVRMVHCFLCT